MVNLDFEQGSTMNWHVSLRICWPRTCALVPCLFNVRRELWNNFLISVESVDTLYKFQTCCSYRDDRMSWTLVPILDLLGVFYFVSSGCLTLVFHRITGVQSLKRFLQTCACSKIVQMSGQEGWVVLVSPARSEPLLSCTQDCLVPRTLGSRFGPAADHQKGQFATPCQTAVWRSLAEKTCHEIRSSKPRTWFETLAWWVVSRFSFQPGARFVKEIGSSLNRNKRHLNASDGLFSESSKHSVCPWMHVVGRCWKSSYGTYKHQ